MSSTPPSFSLRRLDWDDAPIATLDLPGRPMRLRMGYGSGLSRRVDDPPDVVWAIGDRGPNIKVEPLIEHYGVEHLRSQLDREGAKVMLRPDIGPRIAKLRIGPRSVELLAEYPLVDGAGRPVSGLPIPGGDEAWREPALDLAGHDLDTDPAGLDSEGIVATRDGGFWIGDEFGPSLVRVEGGGRILVRYLPHGVDLPGAPYPVDAVLPAIAAKRQINRGFEAIALSPDEGWLFLAFQSPLAHPDRATHERARHVRLWRLRSDTMDLADEYLYQLEPPSAFRRDQADGDVDRSDIKVSEMAWLGQDRLLLLERATLSTKIYAVELGPDLALPACHLDPATRPTVEEMSAAGGFGLPELAKTLMFDSDLTPELPGDQEGMIVLSPTELLLVNDNDFGVEDAETQFWKVIFDEPVLGQP